MSPTTEDPKVRVMNGLRVHLPGDARRRATAVATVDRRMARLAERRAHRTNIEREADAQVSSNDREIRAYPEGPTNEQAATLIFEALGAASTCWEDMSGAGVFQDQRASEIGRQLMADLGYEMPAIGAQGGPR